MLLKRTSSTVFAAALALGLMTLPACQATTQPKAATPALAPVPTAAAQAKPSQAKICGNCHNAEAGSLRGIFDGVAYKTQSIQIKIDEATEILRFDKETLKVANIKPDPENPSEPLRVLKKGKEIKIEYTEKDGKRVATLVAAKPAIKVAPEKLLSTEDVEKLVAQGPEKGKYLLIDARPAPRFMEGAIPTAINIPFPAFDKMAGKLPQNKDALIVYYCGGMT
jgi:hypothetical protein